jgi:hypothetical protein
MKVTMHHSARTAPVAPITKPAICAGPTLPGWATPDHERNRAGKNTNRKPMKSVA